MDYMLSITLNWFQKLFTNIIKTGVIPKHIAFIMDGNRRFAVKNNINKLEGHAKGFIKQIQTLKWCLDLGIPEVTVYAFSIENFKRSKEEVDGLMNMAREMFKNIIAERASMQSNGIQVRVIGKLDLLPRDLQSLISQTILMTKQDNYKITLNVAFAYTARDEMATAVGEVASGLNKGFLLPSDLSEHLIGSCLYSNQSPDPDLLIRTSGEIRFSDFLLWQSSYTCIHFTSLLWPEFSFWNLLRAIFIYQRWYPQISLLRNKRRKLEALKPCSQRIEIFIKEMNINRVKLLQEKILK